MNKGYLNGIYRAKSVSLLTNDQLNELSGLNTIEFINHLQTINYSLGATYNLFDSIIDHNNKLVREELLTLTNNKLFVDSLFHDVDLVNIKIVFKSIKHNISPERFNTSGKYSYDDLYELFKNNNKSFIENEDLELFEKLNKINNENIKEDVEEIEHIYLDYYYEKSKVIDKSLFIYLDFNRFINNFYLTLKFKVSNGDLELYQRLLLDESIVGKDKWFDYIRLDENELIDRLSLLFYGNLEEGVKQFFESNSLILLDKNINNVFEDLMLQESYDSNTLAPVVHFIYLKKVEHKRLRSAYYE